MSNKSVGFLKTHKSASSSVQNILMRWGMKNGMNFVLPSSGNYLRSETQLSYSRDMLADTMWEKKGLEYGMFCLHTVWNTEEVRRTLSGPDMALISIVRDPVDVFESMWHYYDFSQYFGKSLEDFAKQTVNNPDMKRCGFDNRFGRNQMLYDFGLDPENMNDANEVQDKIATIEKEFDLIMVSERFLESKILLTELLGLSPSDAACLKLNSRNSASRPGLNTETQELLAIWLAADYELYNKANSWLDAKLEKMDSDYRTEISVKLEDADKDLAKSCELHQDGSMLSGDFGMWTSRVVGFTPTEGLEEENTKLACMGELQFIDMLRSKQQEKCFAMN
eukprot:GFUD01023045.1.p1 GENE.GFUD01023045.1~~GFUD01023045.1.p1  ORF type:complete len:336 (+),score=80.29 GFUD01023045.1:21-1028(+)